MRIVFFGSGAFAVPTLESITFDGHEVPLVVSQPDRPAGRGRQAQPTPLKEAALAEGLNVITPQNVNAPEIVEQIRSCNADLGYVAAFGQKIGPELLFETFPAGMINLHGSLLPALRGAAPIQWSVINGDAEAGVTVFRLVEKMDAGALLMQRRTAIGEDETSADLHDRLARIGCDAVRETIKLLEADPKTPGEEQDLSLVTMARKLCKQDGHIHFDMPAKALASRINGLWSWPGARCEFQSADGARRVEVTLARVRPYEGQNATVDDDARLGTITDMMAIQARDGAVMPLEIKPAGKKLMSWQEFVNGRHVQAGDRFVPLESNA